MKAFRWIMVALTALYALFAGFTAAVGLFADGGTVWERILVSGIHPLGAVALLFLVWRPRGRVGSGAAVALALVVLSIIGDVAVFAAITTGVIPGDAGLAVAFALVPLLGIAYVIAALASGGHISNPEPAG